MAASTATASASAPPSLHIPSSSSQSRTPRRLSSPFLPLALPTSSSPPLKLATNGSRFSMSSNPKREINLAVPTAVAVLAAALIPDMAEAVAPGVSPSLKNLLLSVVAGGVVLVVIGGAVAAVSTFDPVQRK